MEILAVIGFFTFFVGPVLWSWGCFAFCALVITAPVGAILCRVWASSSGDQATRRTWIGAICWAAGFMPWVYLACEISGRAVPRKAVKAAYAVLFAAWMVGPVIGGFSSAAVSSTAHWASLRSSSPVIGGFSSAAVSSSDLATLFPVFSLLAGLVSLVWVGFVGVAPDRSPRFHIVHLVPGILMTLSMLAWLPYSWIA